MATMTAGIQEAGRKLREDGYEVQLHDEDMPMILIRQFPLPPGWSTTSTDLLLRLPPSFPAGKPDMFWTEPEVLLASGAEPNQAKVIQSYLGRRWRRFSWHPQNWTPARDDIWTFIGFIKSRLARPE